MTINHSYPADVNIVQVDGRDFILVGTAHVSQTSADLVRQVIEQEQPDVVCVELDEARYKTLSEQKKWESLDLRQVIRQKQLLTLIVNLLLSSYQRKLGQKLGVQPGVELLEATKVAQAQEIPVELVDRDVRVTLRRAWQSMSLWERAKLMGAGMAVMFESPEISEEDLTELRKKDVLSEMMKGLGEFMPVLKRVLIDERDQYIAQKTRLAEGQKVVAVVGAGHIEGIKTILEQGTTRDLSEIEKTPAGSPIGMIIGWSIPVIILSAIAWIGWQQGAQAAGENALYWILANGIPAGIGGLIALGHPLTVLTAFVAAPFTSLTPVIGVGYVTAFVQLYLVPPLVKDFQTVGDDVSEWRLWWQSRLLRVLLVFILTTLGSVIGTYVGAYEVLTNLWG